MIIDKAEAHRRAHETGKRFPHYSCRLCYSCEELLAAAILQAVQDTREEAEQESRRLRDALSNTRSALLVAKLGAPARRIIWSSVIADIDAAMRKAKEIGRDISK